MMNISSVGEISRVGFELFNLNTMFFSFRKFIFYVDRFGISN